ncbi:hypothetical protein [Streptomyces sp. SP18CS02]|uniref:hypothetical protein n=1 Tax=Streptomyces sp. SP18CS02 TaxID=3002531 RepID=UPI002E7774C7|nr:hypothetical protein [Streptomyces sp. SP18CS02]MEE1754057.1 hypothetical protein [Streptomyces sp. SP18CS02]
MQRRILTTALAAAGALIAVVLTPFSAQAASYSGGNYGAYAYEGSYPTVSGCVGTFSQKHTASWQGIKLTYFYSSRCGSFARIDDAPGDCVAVAQRADGGGWVSESVDPGITYAYTKIANNLNGRLSRAILSCHGDDLAYTPWY